MNTIATISGTTDHIGARRTAIGQLALRQRSEQHPMMMFGAIVTAFFAWTLIPGEPVFAPSAASQVTIKEPVTTPKSTRLAPPAIDKACEGQGWGAESAECLSMIARASGKTDLRVRLIADAAPADLNTPNIF